MSGPASPSDRPIPGGEGLVAVVRGVVIVPDLLVRDCSLEVARGQLQHAAVERDRAFNGKSLAGRRPADGEGSCGPTADLVKLRRVRAPCEVGAVPESRLVVVGDQLHDLTDPIVRDVLQPRGDVGQRHTLDARARHDRMAVRAGLRVADRGQHPLLEHR